MGMTGKMPHMNKRYESVTFLISLGALVAIIAGHNFERYHIFKDYPVHVFTACDTSIHSCFEADPATADPTFQTGPYAKVEMNAKYAPSCLDEHTCSNFTCDGIVGICQVIYCSADSKETGESCSK